MPSHPSTVVAAATLTANGDVAVSTALGPDAEDTFAQAATQAEDAYRAVLDSYLPTPVGSSKFAVSTTFDRDHDTAPVTASATIAVSGDVAFHTALGDDSAERLLEAARAARVAYSGVLDAQIPVIVGRSKVLLSTVFLGGYESHL